jgi:LacI family transcriptional regulator
MSQITQKDIARILQISRETVTKALKDHPKVSPETKKRVLELAHDMGYTPNLYASSLASKKSKTIGLLVPRIEHSFFSSMIEGIFRYCKEYGYHAIPMVSFEMKVNEILNIKTLLSLRVAGIIANVSYDTFDDEPYRMIKSKGIPVVFFDRSIDNGNYSYVTTDDHKSAMKMTEYAINQGYRKIAHVCGAQNINIGRYRLNGFLEAAKKYNIGVPDEWIQVAPNTRRESGYRMAMNMLEKEERPDFIFAYSDNLAYGVYDAAYELGIKIPEELGVIGFGDIDLDVLMKPPLTSVKQPIGELAKEVVDLLIREIEDPSVSKRSVFLESKLMIRESACRKTT